jgi:aldehyde:ferredoxin oxidoreductase
MLNARSGLMLSGVDVDEFCKHILKAERNFDIAAGLERNAGYLPKSLNPGAVGANMGEWDFTRKEIDEFWKF